MKNIVLPGAKERKLSFYLAMEEYVAGAFEDDCLFVWRVAPTVIIGRNQVLEAEVNMDYCRNHGVRVVRRKSGGGCVYADRGNIMISYVSSRGEVSDVFDRYLSALTGILESLGLEAVRSERNDVLVGGRKVSGNAVQMLPDRSIVHGTLLYDTDMDALEAAVNPPYEKLERHGVASVRQRVANLSDLIEDGRVASVEELEEYLVRSLADASVVLSASQVETIGRMASEYEEYNNL